MPVLDELYQELIIDHGRHPRNFGKLSDATYTKEGYNPLCGDKLTLYIHEKEGVIDNISFDGDGCAISMASASLMTEALKGKTIAYANELFDNFQRCIMQGACDAHSLGKLAALSGVRQFPMRVKCATLPWHTLNALLKGDKTTVASTE
jgi:nitrogen fixation NifU-like protein